MHLPSRNVCNLPRFVALRSIAALGAFFVFGAAPAVAADPTGKPTTPPAQVPPVAPPVKTPLIIDKSTLPPPATVAGHKTGLIRAKCCSAILTKRWPA